MFLNLQRRHKDTINQRAPMDLGSEGEIEEKNGIYGFTLYRQTIR